MWGVHVDGAMVVCTAFEGLHRRGIPSEVLSTNSSGLPATDSTFRQTTRGGHALREVPAMIQSLLADRFEMKNAPRNARFPVYS